MKHARKPEMVSSKAATGGRGLVEDGGEEGEAPKLAAEENNTIASNSERGTSAARAARKGDETACVTQENADGARKRRAAPPGLRRGRKGEK